MLHIFPQTSPPSALQPDEEFETVPHFPLAVRPPFFLPQKETSKCTLSSSPESTIHPPQPPLQKGLVPHFPLPVRSKIHPRENIQRAGQNLESVFSSEVKPIYHLPRAICPPQKPKQNSFADVVKSQHPATPRLPENLETRTTSPPHLPLPNKLDQVPHFPRAIRSGIYPVNIGLASNKLHLPLSPETPPIPHIPRAIRPQRKQSSFADVIQQPCTPKSVGGKENVSLFSSSFRSSTFHSISSYIDSCLYPSPKPCPLLVPISLPSPPLTPLSENKQTPKHNNNLKPDNISNNKPAKNKLQFNKEERSEIKISSSPQKQKLRTVKFPNLQKFSAKGRHFREQIRQVQLHNAPSEQKIMKQPAPAKNNSTGLTLLLEREGSFQEVSLLESKKHLTWVKKLPQQTLGEKKGAQPLVEDLEETPRVNFFETKKIETLNREQTDPLCFFSLPGWLQQTLASKFLKPQKGDFPTLFFSALSPSLFSFVRVLMCEKLTAQSTITRGSLPLTLVPLRKESEALRVPLPSERRVTAGWIVLFIERVVRDVCAGIDSKTKSLWISLLENHIEYFFQRLSPKETESFPPQTPTPNFLLISSQPKEESKKQPPAGLVHLCPNGHLSFNNKNFCSFTSNTLITPIIQKKEAFSQKTTSFQTQKTLVLRIRGGGGIEIPIPEKFVPKIDFDIVENQEQAKEPPRITFLQLLQKMSLQDPAFSDSYGQIDMLSNNFTQKIVEEFLKTFFSFSGNQVPLLLIVNTQNIPRNPIASLSRDTKPFV